MQVASLKRERTAKQHISQIRFRTQLDEEALEIVSV
jgi:hypothetical protein